MPAQQHAHGITAGVGAHHGDQEHQNATEAVGRMHHQGGEGTEPAQVYEQEDRRRDIGEIAVGSAAEPGEHHGQRRERQPDGLGLMTPPPGADNDRDRAGHDGQPHHSDSAGPAQGATHLPHGRCHHHGDQTHEARSPHGEQRDRDRADADADADRLRQIAAGP